MDRGKRKVRVAGYFPAGHRAGLGADDDFRGEIEMLGRKMSRGVFIVNLVLCAHAAYRTQLFLYLKACSRHELNTMNLWGGVDAPKPG